MCGSDEEFSSTRAMLAINNESSVCFVLFSNKKQQNQNQSLYSVDWAGQGLLAE